MTYGDLEMPPRGGSNGPSERRRGASQGGSLTNPMFIQYVYDSRKQTNVKEAELHKRDKTGS